MILQGDAVEVLRTLPAESVNTCITSPPYYGLRDYGVDGQIGLEDTPEAYIERLVDVFREVKRVLRDDGTLWVNIGDSYCGTGDKRDLRDPKYKNGRNGQSVAKNKRIAGIKNKDLIGIPWLLAFALRADGWYLRQDIIWSKPNPMPESVRDRCTKSHEYIFLLSKSQKYYFDAEAIAEPIADSSISRLSLDIKAEAGSYRAHGGREKPMKAVFPRFGGSKYGDNDDKHFQTKSGNEWNPYKNLQEKGQRNYTMHKRRAEGQKDVQYMRRNKRDVWSVSTVPYKEAHFATFPEKLIEPCVLAGAPAGGVVLDCFSGAGTTGVVCARHGREYIGVELNPEYVAMSERRIAAVMEEVEAEKAQVMIGEW